MIEDGEGVGDFLEEVKGVSCWGGFRKWDLVSGGLDLGKEGDVDLYYSGDNEYIKPYGVVGISGMRRGFFQMQVG